MTSPEPETSGQDVVSDEAVAAAVADLRRVAIECVCGTDDGDTGTCTCPSIFEHATYGYEVVEIHGLVEDIARWVLTAAAPHTQAQWAAAKAYEIRAELVCCDIYERDHETDRAGRTHPICFWGEAGARIAEDDTR